MTPISPARLLSLLQGILLTLPFILFGQSGTNSLPFVRTFHTLDYKAGIQNWDFVQNKRGIIYVANNFGLLEFEGNEWETYPVKNQTKVR